MAAIGMGPLAVGRYRYWAVPLLRLPPDPYSPAFVQLRELTDTRQGLAKRLDALEDKTEIAGDASTTPSAAIRAVSSSRFLKRCASWPHRLNRRRPSGRWVHHA